MDPSHSSKRPSVVLQALFVVEQHAWPDKTPWSIWYSTKLSKRRYTCLSMVYQANQPLQMAAPGCCPSTRRRETRLRFAHTIWAKRRSLNLPLEVSPQQFYGHNSRIGCLSFEQTEAERRHAIARVCRAKMHLWEYWNLKALWGPALRNRLPALCVGPRAGAIKR